MDLKTIFNNESSKSSVNTFENEIMLEDKMSRLESHVEINLECKLCLDYKHEIQRQNEKGKMLAEAEKKIAEAEEKSRTDAEERKALKAQIDLVTGFISSNQRWNEYVSQAGSQHLDGSGQWRWR
jgi:hypothetical protein